MGADELSHVADLLGADAVGHGIGAVVGMQTQRFQMRLRILRHGQRQHVVLGAVAQQDRQASIGRVQRAI